MTTSPALSLMARPVTAGIRDGAVAILVADGVDGAARSAGQRLQRGRRAPVGRAQARRREASRR